MYNTLNNKHKVKKEELKSKKDGQVFISDEFYDSKYLEKYYEINYVEKDDFLKNVNIFLDKKYSTDEINLIFENLSDKNFSKLIEKDYIKLDEFLKIKNFNVDNYERYINYKNNNSYDIATVVTYVNIDLDKDDYNDMYEITNLNDFYIVINKHNKVPDTYKPSNLVVMNSSNALRTTVQDIVEKPLNEFFAAAREAGSNLYQSTSYRSFSWQNDLYTSYVSKDGKEKADTYSARPGCSEHHTGLAVDLYNADIKNTRLTKDDEEWIAENAYKYGFIVRYTESNKHITRYMAEPWHIRYVGNEAAKIIYEQNLSFEEYVDLYVKEY